MIDTSHLAKLTTVNLCALLCLQNISEEKFNQLFAALPANTHLETLSLTNVGLTDRTALKLAEALEKNNTLRVVK